MSDPLTALTVLMRTVGWSDGVLARKVGCSRQLVERIRNGRISPSPRMRREISVVLGRELRVDPAEASSMIFGTLDSEPDEPTTVLLQRLKEESHAGR